MIDQLAHVFSLVAHGNLSLHNSEVAKIDLLANPSFQYVSSVKFSRHKSNQDEHGLVVASNISDWFTFLRSMKAIRLLSIVNFEWQQQDVPVNTAFAFSAGESLAIQVDLPNGFELWYPQRKASGQNQKPWVIEFRSLLSPNSHALPAQKLSRVKKQLKEAISQAEKFSKRPDVNAAEFATCFTKALELLDSPNPKAPVHPEILPEYDFNLEARQILASATQAFDVVFDSRGFENPEISKEYVKIIIELYDSIKLGWVMASNSFAP